MDANHKREILDAFSLIGHFDRISRSIESDIIAIEEKCYLIEQSGGHDGFTLAKLRESLRSLRASATIYEKHRVRASDMYHSLTKGIPESEIAAILVDRHFPGLPGAADDGTGTLPPNQKEEDSDPRDV